MLVSDTDTISFDMSSAVPQDIELFASAGMKHINSCNSHARKHCSRCFLVNMNSLAID